MKQLLKLILSAILLFQVNNFFCSEQCDPRITNLKLICDFKEGDDLDSILDLDISVDTDSEKFKEHDFKQQLMLMYTSCNEHCSKGAAYVLSAFDLLGLGIKASFVNGERFLKYACKDNLNPIIKNRTELALAVFYQIDKQNLIRPLLENIDEKFLQTNQKKVLKYLKNKFN